MKIGVLGTGVVGQTLATKLVAIGHDVLMGARDPANPKAVEWAATHAARSGSFAESAAYGPIIINATYGAASLEVLTAAGLDNLTNKILIDVANPLDFSVGMPPTLTVVNTDSLGEQIQAAFPQTRVVKALNTVTTSIMVDPGRIPGEHVIFVAGEDADAKDAVRGLLGEFGWRESQVFDLGGIRAARTMEMYLPLWIAIFGKLGDGEFNIAIHRAKD